jgi:small subunit ribosomal protein S21
VAGPAAPGLDSREYLPIGVSWPGTGLRPRGAWYTVRTSRIGPGRGESQVTKVIVEPDESFENALKRFKKSCEKAGLMSELRKRQHYEKPSVKRKRKTLAARKKAKKRERFFD